MRHAAQVVKQLKLIAVMKGCISDIQIVNKVANILHRYIVFSDMQPTRLIDVSLLQAGRLQDLSDDKICYTEGNYGSMETNVVLYDRNISKKTIITEGKNFFGAIPVPN